MIDIKLVTDLLNKHNVTNKALAEDIQLIINQVYLDGKFSGQSEWYAEQDKDGEWIAEFDFDTGEEIPPNTYGDIPYQTDLHSNLAEWDKIQFNYKDLPSGSSVERDEDDK